MPIETLTVPSTAWRRATKSDSDLASTAVRTASRADAPAVADLIRAARGDRGDGVDLDEVVALLRAGHFLLLERARGGLAGTVYVRLVDHHGYVGLLSIAPDLRGHGFGERLLGVADALCVAYHCELLDVLPPGEPRRPAGGSG